jgi:membrane protease YdiL (CAAX protease family)
MTDKRPLYAYVAILLTSALSLISEIPLIKFILPFLLVVLPLIIAKKIPLKLNFHHLVLGLLAFCVTIFPVVLYKHLLAVAFIMPPWLFLVMQLVGVSFPEEIFFRGFLQEAFGNNYRAVVVVSILFAFAHLPRLLAFGDWLAPLTFFPSLVMGWLYLKTRNILPSAILHFFSNVTLFGFGGF